MATLLEDLCEWLRIPSISTGGGDPADIERAAQWACDRVREAGGECELVRIGDGNPLVLGELRAAVEGAPTVLIYGHYDVQGPGDLSLWTTPPFEPVVRDGRVYARGAADDKGNFLGLLRAACGLASEGALPVNVRVVVEGEEEAGSGACIDWLRADERGADAAIVFDSGMADPDTPAVTLGLRGMVWCDVEVRTGERDVHSGLFGGAALNALEVLNAMLAQVVPAPGEPLRPELRVGAVPADPAEQASWEALPQGSGVLAQAGMQPSDPRAGAEFYDRTGAQPALSVNRIEGGEPRTVVPARASASLSVRTVARQDAEQVRAALESLLRGAAPAGAELSFEWHLAEPALFEVSEPAVQLAAASLERACGRAPAFVRSGGSIPIVAEFAAKGIPTIVTGFVLPDEPIHAPDEHMSLRGLELGEAAGRELLLGFAGLGRG